MTGFSLDQVQLAEIHCRLAGTLSLCMQETVEGVDSSLLWIESLGQASSAFFSIRTWGCFGTSASSNWTPRVLLSPYRVDTGVGSIMMSSLVPSSTSAIIGWTLDGLGGRKSRLGGSRHGNFESNII